MQPFSFEQAKQLIDHSLAHIDLPAEPRLLYEPIRYILNLKGKRLRPVLVLLGCSLFTDDWQKHLKTALAFEIFHNFTLVHDDIMDHADLRRGQPTVHTKYNQNVAINVGDAMMITAYQYLLDTSSPNALQLVKRFNDIAIRLTQGQQRDSDFETSFEVGMDDYIDMIGGKTAVLLAMCLQAGGILCDQSEKVQQTLYDIGYNAGLAFQVQDDYLDLYADVAFGKEVGGDIQNNKKSYLYAKAYTLGTEAQKAALKSIFEAERSPEKVQKALELFDAMNIKRLVAAEIEAYMYKAIAYIESLPIIDLKKKELLAFLMVIKRRKV